VKAGGKQSSSWFLTRCILKPWRWRRYVPPKLLTFIVLHDLIFQETELFNFHNFLRENYHNYSSENFKTDNINYARVCATCISAINLLIRKFLTPPSLLRTVFSVHHRQESLYAAWLRYAWLIFRTVHPVYRGWAISFVVWCFPFIFMLSEKFPAEGA
jgi:hypothetical protein